jgi:hypothetical protein
MSEQLESDMYQEYQERLRKKMKKDETEWVCFHDSVSEYEEESQPHIRLLHKDKKDPCASGLERTRGTVPKAVTLEEKEVAHKTYKEVLALAGIAKMQQKSTFDCIKDRIDQMREQARNILSDAKFLEEQLIYLRKLAVLDY